MVKYLWYKNKRYTYYDTYNTYEKAIKTAKHYKKKLKSQYYIIKSEEGFIMPTKKYRLYLTKVFKLW